MTIQTPRLCRIVRKVDPFPGNQPGRDRITHVCDRPELHEGNHVDSRSGYSWPPSLIERIARLEIIVENMRKDGTI